MGPNCISVQLEGHSQGLSPGSPNMHALIASLHLLCSAQDAFVATDRETGRSRGFGFVTLEANAAKSACSECDGTEFMGR